MLKEKKNLRAEYSSSQFLYTIFTSIKFRVPSFFTTIYSSVRVSISCLLLLPLRPKQQKRRDAYRAKVAGPP